MVSSRAGANAGLGALVIGLLGLAFAMVTTLAVWLGRMDWPLWVRVAVFQVMVCAVAAGVCACALWADRLRRGAQRR